MESVEIDEDTRDKEILEGKAAIKKSRSEKPGFF